MVMSKRIVLVLVVAGLLLSGTASAIGPANPGADPEDGGIATSAFIANIVASFPELGLVPEQIQALREAGYGWGEIVIACDIAASSGQTLDGVIALATEGAGWGEIAKSLGIQPKAFGQSVREVIGRSGARVKAQEERRGLDEAAAMDMLRERFGLSVDEIRGLADMGLNAQDVLCAVSIVAAAGDASRLELVLQHRIRQQSWFRIAESLGIDRESIIPRVVVRDRIEFKNALKEAVKEQIRAHKEKGKPDNPGAGKGQENSGNAGGGSGSPGSPGGGQGEPQGAGPGGKK